MYKKLNPIISFYSLLYLFIFSSVMKLATIVHSNNNYSQIINVHSYKLNAYIHPVMFVPIIII